MFRASVVLLMAAMPVVADPPAELNDKNFAEWRDRIRPTEAERSVETIDWHPTLWDGLIVAQKEDKPILMWAMNGHPLACT